MKKSAQKIRGKKTILNDELINKICEGVENMLYLTTIAERLEMPRQTIQQWLRKGKDAQQKQENGQELTDREQLYLKFQKEYREAEATAEMKAVEQIQQAGREDWRALAWFLERRYPDDWGKQRVKSVQHKINKTKPPYRSRASQPIHNH